MNYEESKVFEKALTTYGFESQTKMLLEEMSELTKAMCKYWRGKRNLEEIAEEMADVQIMLDQMTLLFQNHGLQQQYRLEKIERLRQRLEGG